MCQFTVVIPTYNRSRLLDRAIASALGQSLRPGQVIVVDDGSSDDTAEVCRKHGEAIQYVFQPNAGVAAARNHGARLARHPWTAFLDSDDYWVPTHLEKIAAAIKSTSGRARFYFADMQISNGAADYTLWARTGFKLEAPFRLAEDGTDWMLLQREPCSVQCSVFNTETLLASGGFDVRFRVSEDRDLFYRLGIGGPICAVNTVGCVQTSDARQENRLTGIMDTRSEGFWKLECLLWAGLMSRFSNLGPSHRRVMRCYLAIAHWRLARLYWRSGRIASSLIHLLQSLKTEPVFVLGFFRRGTSAGWEKTAPSAEPLPGKILSPS